MRNRGTLVRDNEASRIYRTSRSYVNSEENERCLHAVSVEAGICIVNTAGTTTTIHYLETGFGDLASGMYVLRMLNGGDSTKRFNGRASIHSTASDTN